MKENMNEVVKNTEEMERLTKEIEDTDVLDLCDEGVKIEKLSISDSVNTIKKSFLESME